jgi:aspartyl-tRNA(Asn)/glutamyl-tRNA(Gln) amidotransferase subunit C
VAHVNHRHRHRAPRGQAGADRRARERLPELAGELSHILDFMEQLNEVDVEGVEPMTSVTPMRLKRRADEVTDGNMPERILSNAPDAREGFFAVPKVVE